MTTTKTLEQRLIEVLQRENQELKTALRPFAHYASQRDKQPLRGLGDTIHLIHRGTPYEAEITIQQCRQARHILNKCGWHGGAR